MKETVRRGRRATPVTTGRSNRGRIGRTLGLLAIVACLAPGAVRASGDETDGATGACCLPEGACAPDVTPAVCALFDGIYQGDGSSCATVICTGARLPIEETPCIDGVTQSQCVSFGGTFRGLGSLCATEECEGACCLPGGACLAFTVDVCVANGGFYQGNGSSCATTDCTGACCMLDGTCTGLAEANCNNLGGFYQGNGTTCAAAPCPCLADVDGDGEVGFSDLLEVLSNWGPCVSCPQDIDGNGDVGFVDLLFVLSDWGACE